MRIIDSLDEMTEIARGWLTTGTVGFVLISGQLHNGHKTLLQTIRNDCETLVVTLLDMHLFSPVFPLYAPVTRDRLQDIAILHRFPVDVVFLPAAVDLYSSSFATYITPEGPLVEHLENTYGPGAQRLLSTTLVKLLQLVHPDVTFCSRKDILLSALIRQLIRDLHIDVRLRILPTIREHDGLALSNCNQQLAPPERQAATRLYQALQHARSLIEAGRSDTQQVIHAITTFIARVPLLDSVRITVCHPDTFVPFSTIVPGTLIMINARAGTILLSDSMLWTADKQWYL